MTCDRKPSSAASAHMPRSGILARFAQSHRLADGQEIHVDAEPDGEPVWSLEAERPEAEQAKGSPNDASRSSGSPESGTAAGRSVQSVYSPVELIVELAFDEQARAAKLDLRKMPSGAASLMVVQVPTEAWEQPLGRLVESIDQQIVT